MREDEAPTTLKVLLVCTVVWLWLVCPLIELRVQESDRENGRWGIKNVENAVTDQAVVSPVVGDAENWHSHQVYVGHSLLSPHVSHCFRTHPTKELSYCPGLKAVIGAGGQNKPSIGLPVDVCDAVLLQAAKNCCCRASSEGNSE